MPMPKDFGYTEAGAMLRICERFGQDPITWPDSLSQGNRDVLLAWERIRQHEERSRAPQS